MKRYLLFSGVDYEAIGGWNDFDKGYDDIWEAKQAHKEAINQGYDWSHIVDKETFRIVWRSHNRD